MLALCRGEEQPRWSALLASEHGERFRQGGAKGHRFWAIEFDDGHGSELPVDLTLVPESEDGFGESEASFGRIDGVEHLVERRIEAVAVIIPQCVDGPLHVRRDDARQAYLQGHVEFGQIEQLVEIDTQFDLVGS